MHKASKKLYNLYKTKGGVLMAIDSEKNTQVLVTMPWDLKEEIEDYQFANRVPSRTAAILELIRKGLDQEKEPTE